MLVDDDGRLVHIDFGFMLSNSPGGVNFEAAPFKLTRELLEIMDSNSEGKPSELFDYFKVRCWVTLVAPLVRSLLHMQKLCLLSRMRSSSVTLSLFTRLCRRS